MYLALCRFKDAWSFASALDNKECWSELAMAALHHLDIDMGEQWYVPFKWYKFLYSVYKLGATLSDYPVMMYAHIHISLSPKLTPNPCVPAGEECGNGLLPAEDTGMDGA